VPIVENSDLPFLIGKKAAASPFTIGKWKKDLFIAILAAQ